MTDKTSSIGCTEVRASLPAFAADELAAGESRRIQEHLERCPTCDRFLRFEGAFDEALDRTLQREAAPAPLVVRIHRALDAEDASAGAVVRRVFSRPRARWALAACLAAVLVVPAALVVLDGSPRLPLAAAGILRSTEGVLVCAECARHQVPTEAQRGCRAHGHHTAFRTDDGRIWEFVDSDDTRPLIMDAERIGDRLEVKGLFIPEIHYVNVGSYRYASRGARQGA